MPSLKKIKSRGLQKSTYTIHKCTPYGIVLMKKKINDKHTLTYGYKWHSFSKAVSYYCYMPLLKEYDFVIYNFNWIKVLCLLWI